MPADAKMYIREKICWVCLLLNTAVRIFISLKKFWRWLLNRNVNLLSSVKICKAWGRSSKSIDTTWLGLAEQTSTSQVKLLVLTLKTFLTGILTKRFKIHLHHKITMFSCEHTWKWTYHMKEMPQAYDTRKVLLMLVFVMF